MNTAQIMSRTMTLAELVSQEIQLPLELDTNLTGMEIDSRRVESGDVFLACKGGNFDGREFINEAVAKGAVAVLVEKDSQWHELVEVEGVPVIPVDNLSLKIGKLAASFYDHPARALWLIGITGTNGKTSVCQFVAQALSALGVKSGISGTLGSGIYGEEQAEALSGPSTTPDAVTVQRIFEEARIQNCQAMVMEVSSHGLQQKRVNVKEFDVAVFTNLSRDHLDYHGSMAAYGEEKRKLFNNPKLHTAVLNLDDLYSALILNTLAKSVKSYTYSLHNAHADVYPRAIKFERAGTVLDIASPWGSGSVQSKLLGSFNVSNLLSAFTVVAASLASKADFNFQQVLTAIGSISPVKGRMESIGEYPLGVVIDYAHTPDGLKNALTAVREHYSGKIWCVFGCGGERDKGKRPLMAEVAEQMADRLIITDDNPRGESSAEIIRHILHGVKNRNAVHVQADRALAIAWAVENAAEQDVVLIAGKGHEEYQDVGGNRTIFSDVRHARVCLNKRYSN